MKTHHISLKVTDLADCESFYADVLGLSIVERHKDKNGNERSVWLKCGELILMLEKFEGAPPAKDHNYNHPGWHLLALAIDMETREDWKKRLRDAKIVIEEESPHSIYFRDPEGNRLALSHYPVSINIGQL
jgi:glyoxylase I family protein